MFNLASGHSEKFIIPLEKLNGLEVTASIEFPGYAEFNYHGVRGNEWRTFSVSKEDNSIREHENDYCKIHGVQSLYHYVGEKLLSLSFCIVRNKLVLITNDSATTILNGFICLNRDCYEKDCLVQLGRTIFCGICGMEHRIDPIGSIINAKQEEISSLSKTRIFVGKNV